MAKIYITRDEDGDLQVFTEKPEPVAGIWGTKWDVSDTSQCRNTIYTHTALGQFLEELTAPLSFKAGQLAELEIKEVERWDA